MLHYRVNLPNTLTLARLLEKINGAEIELAHITLIKQLISGKNLKNSLLIADIFIIGSRNIGH